MKVLVFQSIGHRNAWLKDNTVTPPIILQEESEAFGSSSLVGGFYGNSFPEGSVVSDCWIYEMWIALSLLLDTKDFEVHVIGPSLRINGELSEKIPEIDDKVSYSFEGKLPVYFLKENKIILVTDDIPYHSFLKKESEYSFAKKLTPEEWMGLIKTFLKISLSENKKTVGGFAEKMKAEQNICDALKGLL